MIIIKSIKADFRIDREPTNVMGIHNGRSMAFGG